MFKIQRRRQQVARQQGAYKQERPDSKTGMDQEYTEMNFPAKIKIKDTMYIKKEPKDELLIKSGPAKYVEDAPINVEKVDLHIQRMHIYETCIFHNGDMQHKYMYIHIYIYINANFRTP